MSLPQDPKEKFIARDVSWLMFNERVLQEALGERNPLLERIKFLAIFTNNMDEFYMTRVASLKRLIESGHNQPDKFGLYPQDLLTEIKTKVASLTEQFYTLYDAVKKELEANKVNLKKYSDLNAEQKKAIDRFTSSNLFPIITPMAIDQGHPFPVLPSRTLAFAVNLIRQEKSYFAVIPIPKSVPRVFRLPSAKDEYNFILVDEIIRNHLDDFFRGYKIHSAALFRVVRDSEVVVDEEYSSDLLKSVEMEVKKRRRAKAVHLEMEKSSSNEIVNVLSHLIDFPENEVSFINGELDLTFLFELSSLVTIPKLTYLSYVSKKFEYESIFDKIKEDDFLLHLPYQSFQPTIDFFQQAAKCPLVLGIKVTLYRTNEESHIVQALKDAAKNKKQVTVVVELKARFDEEKNIDWAKELEDAGCHVIYGMPGMKIHSKMALIVRKEDERIRRYVHLSTGNYNEKTAKMYTDVSYFTANDDFAKDVSEMFNVITGYSMPARWKRVVSSPYDLREYFSELVDREISFHKKYKNGSIFAKFNSLEDPAMIEKLYEASNAGVQVRLLIRGICCLVPGIPGLSENIEVRSIIGRFLEHARSYVFNNNGNFQTYLSSADWMSRNLDRRIELLFEVQKDVLKDHLRFIMETHWKDNVKSHLLLPERTYTHFKNTESPFNAQEYFIEYYTK
jgi:polyphosphate kinase